MNLAIKFLHAMRKISLVLSLSSLLILPVTSYAATTRESTPKTSAFCTNLPNYTSTINSKISGLQTKVDQFWANQGSKLTTDSKQVDQKVAADRQSADTERLSNFTKLENRAHSDTQKQAIKTYETAINDAVTVRRSAFDAARQTFRTNLVSDMSIRHNTVSGQINTFQGSVNNAITTAQTNCATTPSGPTAREAFVSSLKSARLTFQSERAGDDKVSQQVKILAETRNNSFKSAEQAFQTSIQTARQNLKQSFGSSTI